MSTFLILTSILVCGALPICQGASYLSHMIESGIIDPTKVARTALQNAASISGLMITPEAMIAEKPESDAAGGGMPGGGMPGGMGGMM